MLAIAKREFKSLFTTMTAPIFCAVMIAVTGIYFIAYNIGTGYQKFSYVLLSSLFIMMIIVPLLTMRSFSEERRQKTDQLLLTAPVSLGDIVLGKFFAMCAVFAIPVLIFCACPLIVRSFGEAKLAGDYATLLVFFVIGCFYISVGAFISSLTESQVIAAVCSIGAMLLIYLWSGLVNMLPSTASGTALVLLLVLTLLSLLLYASTKNWLLAGGIWLLGALALLAVWLVNSELLAGRLSEWLGGFAVTTIMSNFGEYDLFDLQGLIKLLLATGLMLFLTAQSLQKRRWS
ncbi:MAG: ABC transporter permease [Oscillospiraceae bacterium]|nr:ABC transporter permease [Oscillospiraceae bacterium]